MSTEQEIVFDAALKARSFSSNFNFVQKAELPQHYANTTAHWL